MEIFAIIITGLSVFLIVVGLFWPSNFSAGSLPPPPVRRNPPPVRRNK